MDNLIAEVELRALLLAEKQKVVNLERMVEDLLDTSKETVDNLTAMIKELTK